SSATRACAACVARWSRCSPASSRCAPVVASSNGCGRPPVPSVDAELRQLLHTSRVHSWAVELVHRRRQSRCYARRMTARARSPFVALPVSFAIAVAVAFGCASDRTQMERFHVDNRVDEGAFPDVPAVVLLDRTELTFTFAPG